MATMPNVNGTICVIPLCEKENNKTQLCPHPQMSAECWSLTTMPSNRNPPEEDYPHIINWYVPYLIDATDPIHAKIPTFQNNKSKYFQWFMGALPETWYIIAYVYFMEVVRFLVLCTNKTERGTSGIVFRGLYLYICHDNTHSPAGVLSVSVMHNNILYIYIPYRMSHVHL